MSPAQLSVLNPPASLPEGLQYQAGLISPDEERELIEQFRGLDFREFEFQGYLGKRRTVSFGLHYDFSPGKLRKTEEIPAFLHPLRDRAAGFAGIDPSDLQHVLITEYVSGAGIGWHRDRPVFEDVVGISLLSPCRFRLRRKRESKWERASLIVEPRSAYLLRGPVRTEWEHSIPPAERLRYSVTFRSLKGAVDV
jgi:alkylated DNA repair dioxygenase AlkB